MLMTIVSNAETLGFIGGGIAIGKYFRFKARPKHKHLWEITKQIPNENSYKIWYQRKCSLCDLEEIRKVD